MAQRKYEQFQQSLEKGVVTIYGNVPIGATGAVGTLVATKNQGIYSVVRNSAGNYTINLGISASSPDKYQRLMAANVQVLFGTVAAATSGYQVWADNSASGNVIIQFYGPTNSSTTTQIAADPDNGATLLIELKFKNSTV